MGPPFLDHFTSTGVISQRCSTALKLNHVKKTPVGDMAIREALPFALLLICSSSRLKVESLFLKFQSCIQDTFFFLKEWIQGAEAKGSEKGRIKKSGYCS